MKNSSTLEDVIFTRVRLSPLLEVDVGARLAKEYSLPHFGDPKPLSSGTLYLGNKSSFLES
jgi:hypothetical protein